MPEGDMVIHAGDISGVGKEMEVIEFLEWFSNLPYKYKIFIAGNHDWLFEKERLFAKQLLESYPGVIYLENSGMNIEGISIYGVPVTPTFFDWAFNRDRGDNIKVYWLAIPENTDILITHGPPHGILDRTPMTKEHTGCEDLLKSVSEIRPKFHIFGHIHSAAGIYKTEHTTFINASVLDDNYKLKYKPQIITI
jgi:Icc-related predicted phosphoesterase